MAWERKASYVGATFYQCPNIAHFIAGVSLSPSLTLNGVYNQSVSQAVIVTGLLANIIGEMRIG